MKSSLKYHTVLLILITASWTAEPTWKWLMNPVVLHTGVAYCLYFSGMASLPVQTVTILGYLEPVVSVLCSAILLHEAMSPTGWVSAVLVIAAAALSEIMSERKY